MTMTVEVAKLRIARNLYEAEAALDDALRRQSQLMTTLVEARRGTGVAPFTGQEALMRLAKLQQSMLSAGGDLARVHCRLQDVGRELMGDAGGTTPTAVLAAAVDVSDAAQRAA
ncbi:MAG: hypothetical protein KGL48_13225 [Sphingomonadales bacterium]|nr:hypothetical protein [Sphingomonadales bacterium]MDE2570706.1 hypothetical protein [Sphingomonadales bacterium]